MATVKMMMSGGVENVTVPTALNTESDCSIWMTYHDAIGNKLWNGSLLKDFETVFNAGTVDLDVVITLANDRFLNPKEDGVLTEEDIHDELDDLGLKLTR